VVLAGAATSTGTSQPERKLSIDERQDAECDPCPIGEWAIGLETMATFFESFGQGVSVQISGTWTFDFDGAADGGSTLADEKHIVLTFPGLAGAETALSLDGSGMGNWKGDETVLVLSDYSSQGDANFFGVTASGADGGAAAALEYGYDEDGVLTITSNGATIMASRIDPSDGDPYFE
jgi:hypothetical protein